MSYKLNGQPEAVANKSNGDDESELINNRLAGLPSAVPQTTFIAALLTAWRNATNAVATLIETVGRRISTAEDAGQKTAFATAADAGAHVVTLTADDPTQSTTLWTIDDVDELDAIYGGSGNEGKGLWYGSFDDAKKSLEGAVQSLLAKAASMGVNVILVADQDAGTIKLASFANDGALTTAANTALAVDPDVDTTVWVTHTIPEPASGGSSSGPHFGL